jgi:hypothetical protein
MSSRTLADLETEIRFLYDLEGLTTRHTQVAIFRRINANYRTLRDRLTSEGCTLLLASIEAQQTVIGRTTGYSGTLLSDTLLTVSGNGFVIVTDVAVQVGASWLAMRHANAGEAEQDTDGVTTGIPSRWGLQGVSNEVGATEQHQGVLVWPALDAARNFRVTGLPAWPELLLGTNVIADGLGLLDWVIAAVGVEVASRDDDVALYQARVGEREAKLVEVRKRAMRRAPGAVRRVNVRTRGR